MVAVAGGASYPCGQATLSSLVWTVDLKPELPSPAPWKPQGKSLWNSVTAPHAEAIAAHQP